MFRVATAMVLGGVMMLAAATLPPSPAFAQSAEESVATRIAGMKQIGANMKAIGGFLKGGKRAGTIETVGLRGQAIAAFAEKIPAMFPKGTGPGALPGKTRAKAEIWTDWNGFVAAAMKMKAGGEALVAAAESGDKAKVGAALKMTGASCGQCHKPYRGPKLTN